MGYARARVNGMPEEIYIVTFGEGDRLVHKLYSSLGAARGVVTREKQWRKDQAIHLYAIKLGELELLDEH